MAGVGDGFMALWNLATGNKDKVDTSTVTVVKEAADAYVDWADDHAALREAARSGGGGVGGVLSGAVVKSLTGDENATVTDAATAVFDGVKDVTTNLYSAVTGVGSSALTVVKKYAPFAIAGAGVLAAYKLGLIGKK